MPAAERAKPPRRFRRWFGASVFGALSWFPASLAVLPLVGFPWLLEQAVRARWPRIGRVLGALWLAVSLGAVWTLGRLGPFLNPADWVLAAAAGGLAWLVAHRRPEGRARRLWLALALALPLAVFPPMPPGFATRAAILCASAGGFAVFLWLVGADFAARVTGPQWGMAIAIPSVALRALLFWLLPTANAEPVLRALPGARLILPSWPDVRLGSRYGMPINWHDLRVAMAGCEPGRLVVGTLDALYFSGKSPGAAWDEVRFPPGDQLALDCPRGKLWVPEMVKEKLWDVDLTTHAVEKPFETCDFAGPTVIAFDVEKHALYGYPGGEHLGRYDPDTHDCRIAVGGGTIVGFSASDVRQEALVMRNGVLERCPIDGSERCEVVLRLYDERLPRWLVTDRMNKATLVTHFGKVVEDTTRGQVFATSLQSGVLYRLDRESLRETGRVFLEPGIRWVQLDPERRRVYVGGFVRGDLFAIDADSLEVVGRAFVSRKIRYFEPLANGHLVLATSAGVIDLDPAQLPDPRR